MYLVLPENNLLESDALCYFDLKMFGEEKMTIFSQFKSWVTSENSFSAHGPTRLDETLANAAGAHEGLPSPFDCNATIDDNSWWRNEKKLEQKCKNT